MCVCVWGGVSSQRALFCLEYTFLKERQDLKRFLSLLYVYSKGTEVLHVWVIIL